MFSPVTSVIFSPPEESGRTPQKQHKLKRVILQIIAVYCVLSATALIWLNNINSNNNKMNVSAYSIQYELLNEP